ncbi:MAG: O-antigen ligase family protein [Thermodesulfobacteriota bacterium]
MLFFGLLFFIFLIIIRPQDFVAGVKDTRLVFYTMGVLLPAWFMAPFEKKLFQSPQDRFVLLFYCWFVMSTLTLFWIAYTVETFTETLKLALIYYFTVTIVDSEQRLKTACWTMVFFMSLVALMGVLQYYGIDWTGAGMMWSDDKQVWQIRGIGFFDNPNDLAYSVVLVVPFMLGLFFATDSVLVRAAAFSVLYLNAYCIYLTRSRGGQLALGVCLLTWTYLWLTDPVWKKRIRVVVLIGILVIFSVQTGGYRDDESAMGRIEAWVAGFAMMQAHPLLGVGKGQFLEYFPRDAHNSYVRAGAELGVVGLYAFIGILFFSFMSLRHAPSETLHIKWRLYHSSMGSFLASFAVASLFSSRIYDAVFMTVVSLTGILGRLMSQEAQEEGIEELPTVLVEKGVWNKQVFGLTIATIVVWKLFLVQVW